MLIPPDHKFACIPISFGPAIVGALPLDPQDIGQGAFLSTKRPLDWEKHWIRWLGELQAKTLEDSRFFIVATAPTSHAELLDEENRSLITRVQYMLWALMIHGVPEYEHGKLIVAGGTPGGVVQIRQVNPLLQLHHPRPAADWRLDATMVGSIRRVYAGIVEAADRRHGFQRLRGAIRAWHIAVSTDHPGERIHNFVRVLDGLLVANKMGPFANRLVRFLRPAEATTAELHAMFKLRNEACHLGDWKRAVASLAAGDAGEVADRLSFRCERFASQVLVQVLGDPATRSEYETEERAAAFMARVARSG